MEHRWGRRSTVNVAVTLHSGAGRVIRGRLANVSLSGALVLTDARLPAFTQLVVELESAHPGESPPETIPAFVVREASRGVALEWTEFSPPAITALLRRPAATLGRNAEEHPDHHRRPDRRPGRRPGSRSVGNSLGGI